MVKPNSVLGPVGEADEQLVGCLDRAAAVLAHEMAMGAGGQVVGGRAVPEVGMDDDPEPFELLEVPVDGGEVDVGSSRLDDGRQILGAVMARVVEDGLQEQAA